LTSFKDQCLLFVGLCTMALRALGIATLATLASSTVAGSSQCADGIWCKQVYASRLTFDCRLGWPTGRVHGNVMLLHGFPEWADMYDDTMRALAARGYASAACDQRGYSPGASPNDTASYHYDTLRQDVFHVAWAVGFKKFHLVGHDHGGALGWVVAGTGSKKILSYTSLSIPHLDAFSLALMGPEPDLQQQCASQYFNMFVETNSATSHNNLFCNAFKNDRLDCDTVQRGLYWYNGARNAGYMAIPPIFDASEMMSQGGYCAASAPLRGAWGSGSGESPKEGQPQQKRAGDIHVPTLFVCGSSDTSLLCNRPYAKSSENYCRAGYTYLEVNCGHDLLSCEQQPETQKVIAAIVDHIVDSGSVDCLDSPSDWVSGGGGSDRESCSVYASLNYCTPAGGEGSGWKSEWGKISDWANRDGLSALEACCACGGGRSNGVKTDMVV